MINISIVIATYNGRKYLKEQLESIVTQTRRPDEIILIDDRSTDGTADLAEDILSSSMIPYRVIRHKENAGVTKTFEEGIETASGDYVMICDQDDIWLQEKIQNTEEIIEKTGYPELVVCNAEIADKDAQPTGKSMFDYISLNLQFLNGIYALRSHAASRLFLHRNYATGMCSVFKRETALKAIPFSQNMTYDAWLAWNAALNGSVVFTNQKLVYYRQHGNNVIGTKRDKQSPIEYLKKRREFKDGLFRKYNDLNQVTDERLSIKASVEDACRFHEQRIRPKNPGHILKNRSKYKQYTGNAGLEMIKDMLEIIFVK